MNEEEHRQRELVDAIRVAAGHLVEVVGKGRASFIAPSNWSDRAAARNEIETLSEAAKKLGEPFHKNNPGIPWEALKTLRKRMVHYLDADTRPVGDVELWKFIAEDIPVYERKLRRPVFPKVPEAEVRRE